MSIKLQPLERVLSAQPRVVLTVERGSLLLEDTLPRHVDVIIRHRETRAILFRSAQIEVTPDQTRFRPLFDATWIGHAAVMPLPSDVASDVDWRTVRDAALLTSWEAACSGEAARPEEPVFRPALLADREVAVLAGVRDGRVIAGVVANRSDSVTGISNLFVPDDVPALRAAALAAVAAAFPGTALVGYEHGDDLAAMLALGFTALGPLRVWEIATAAP